MFKHRGLSILETSRKDNFLPLVSFGLLALVGVLLSISKIYDDDFFWHLATGRWIWEHKSVPGQDVFGFVTQGSKWIPFEWGWDLLTFALYSLTNSYAAIQLLPPLVWICVALLQYSTMRKLSVSPIVILFTMSLTLIILLDRLTVRPHLISLLGFSLISYLLFTTRDVQSAGFKKLYLLPCIFLVWTNMHMGVLAGLLFFFLFVLSEIIRYFATPAASHQLSANQPSGETQSQRRGRIGRLSLLFFLSCGTLLINPHGIDTYFYTYAHTKLKTLTVIMEWLPPLSYPTFSRVLLAYKLLLIIGAVSIICWFRRRDSFPALVYASFALYSLTAVRFIGDFAIATAPGTALGANELFQKFPSTVRSFANGKVVMGMIAVVLMCTAWFIPGDRVYNDVLQYQRHFGFGIDDSFFSQPMMKFLQDHNISGKPFNQFELGGELIWERPAEKNFIDSRNLSDEIVTEYMSIVSPEPGFEKKLDGYGIDYLLLRTATLRESATAMKNTLIPYCTKRRDEWKLVYWDDQSFLYLKNVAKFQEVIGKYQYSILQPYLFAYSRSEFDSLRRSMPPIFDLEMKRKLAEEPGGTIISFISRRVSVPSSGN